jgi:gliding motility-associated lipoprotein GldH
MRICFIALFILFLFFRCDSKRVFENNIEFKDRNWKIAQPVAFQFQITDTTTQYNLLLNVRNSLDYPYARLFVNCELRAPDSSSLSKKMISGYLFDQKTGKPFGTSGLGDVYDHQLSILNNYSFKKPGEYKMSVQQFMRMDTIRGILAVGVRVEKVDKKK